MGLNNNYQEPGETNTDEAHNDQHITEPTQIMILTKNQDDN